MPRVPTASPDRILAAAALEFAERGYAGARVDRIARRARVNKAMLYYHFGSKQSLYRVLLRQTFASAAERLGPIVASDASPDEQIRQIVAVIGRFIVDHRFFPAIMLREVADGGVHLDRDTLAVLAALPRSVAAVVRRGVARGRLRDVHPVAAYFMIFAPIVMYLAGTPLRTTLTRTRLADMSSLSPDVFLEQLQESVRLAFAAPNRSRHSVNR
jgi:TetR/AcrR family transcriptional regulator